MKTLAELNIVLNKMTANKALVDSTRSNIVNDIIKLIINEAKGHTFTNKRVAQKWIIEELLSDDNKNLDNYSKRALKVSKAILVDGYKIKKEALTIAQAEQLIKCPKAVVNKLMALNHEEVDENGESEYTINCKEVIKEDNQSKAIEALNQMDKLHILRNLKEDLGEDVRKVLNLMLKAL